MEHTSLRGSPCEWHASSSAHGLTGTEYIVPIKPGIRTEDCWSGWGLHTTSAGSYSHSSPSPADSTTAPSFTFAATRRSPIETDGDHTHIAGQKETQLRAHHRNTRQEVQGVQLPYIKLLFG